MKYVLIALLLQGCAAFEAAYYCARAPQPTPGYCPP